MCVKDREHWRLCLVRMKGRDFCIEVASNVNASGGWGERDRLSVGQCSRRGGVVELLRAMRLRGGGHLLGKAVVESCLVERKSRQLRGHGVVRVFGDRPRTAPR